MSGVTLFLFCLQIQLFEFSWSKQFHSKAYHLCIEESIVSDQIPQLDFQNNETIKFGRHSGCTLQNYTLISDPCLNQFNNETQPRLFYFLLNQKKDLICVFNSGYLLNTSSCGFQSHIDYYPKYNVSIVKVYWKIKAHPENIININITDNHFPIITAAFPSYSNNCSYKQRLGHKDQNNFYLTIIFAVIITFLVAGMYIAVIQRGFIRYEQVLIDTNNCYWY